MLPATAGLAAVQINIFVNSVFASHEPGAVSWLNYAFRILYLPIGLFGVAAGTIATTGLAQRAAADDLDGLRRTLNASWRMQAFLTVPATLGLLLLAAPIVRLLYERGRFTSQDTERTAVALALYGVGLVAYAAVKVLAPAFYALGRPGAPLLASVAAVATNLVLNVALHERLGYRSVALGTSLAAIVNALALIVAFERRVGGLVARELLAPLGRMCGAAAAMAPVVVVASRIAAAEPGSGLARQLFGVLLPIAIGVAAYFAAGALMGLSEPRQLARAVARHPGPRG
jgi:putative peptidoglycan lipid II flippase